MLQISLPLFSLCFVAGVAVLLFLAVAVVLVVRLVVDVVVVGAGVGVVVVVASGSSKLVEVVEAAALGRGGCELAKRSVVVSVFVE